jgi:hypothetical protein
MMMKNLMGLFVGVRLTHDKTRLRKTFRNIGTFSLSLAMLGLTTLLAVNSLVFAQERHGHARSKAKESRDSAGNMRHENLRRATPIRAEIQSQDVATSREVRGQSITPVSVSIVSFQQLAEMKPGRQASKGTVLQAMPAPGIITDTEAPPPPEAKTPQTPVVSGGPSIPSPPPANSFLGQEDGPKIGSGFFVIPPDTQGAVGIDKVFTNTNSNYRIHNKTTGAALSTVSSDTFWASSTGSGFFDPRIVFDPINQRWILAMVSNAQTVNSSVEIAVSQTSDPAGSYFLFRFIEGCTAGAPGCIATTGGETSAWADFPMLGFNKNWVAVSTNLFGSVNGFFHQGRLLVLDYPTLRTGTANGTLFTGAGLGFCLHPAETYDAIQGTLFMPQHLSSGGASYDLSTITGTPAAPAVTLGTSKVRPGGNWTQPGGDILPQNCVPGSPVATFLCPGTPRGADVGDAQVRNNSVYRNGFIYYTQSVGLPAGGLTHVATQWTKLDTSGNFADGGRVEDPTATATNGGKWYAYPSIAVNRNDDLVIGFTQFASNQFAAAGYVLRLHGDAPGTTRDPFIYKAGEDYYQKTFGGSRNRWGDYSATRIDPVNDRDLWTIQEYAQLRVPSVPADGLQSNDSRWGTWWAKLTLPAGPSDLKISEFRLRGFGGADDEYVEIYNNSDAPLTVTTLDGSGGYALAASDGVVRFIIPNGTIIPGRGHYLGVNSIAYALSGYPAGNGTTATGDATFAIDIPDNAGIALFNTATPANFSLATRLDAVGSSTEANTLYKEGTGYPALSFGVESALFRDLCGKGGSTTILGPCPTAGFPKDTDNNASDFVYTDTNGIPEAAGQRIGAPGPKNLSSPIQRNSSIPDFLLDRTVAASSSPNRVRDPTPDPGNNSALGTLDIRRRFTNSTGSPITRLRFRVVDMSIFPVPVGFADLRARTGLAILNVMVNDPATCAPAGAPCMVTVEGTTLETPPLQPQGGGFNSSLSAGTITLGTPLAPGASINVHFLLGVQQVGTFKFFVNMEVLP